MKRIKKILYHSTLLIIFILLVYSSIHVITNKYYLQEYNKVNKIIISNKVEPDTNNSINNNDNISTNTTTISKPTTSSPKTLEDYRKVHNNNDIVGKISIPNTNLSMLLTQTTNNTYYLDHLINKEYNKLGSTFVDYRTNLNTSKKINIYGHNNGKNSVSFNLLTNYLDKTYYEQHKLIKIETNNNIETYEIFSIQITNNNNHMQVSFTDIEWYLHLEDIINNSIYTTNTSIDDITKMITLQTCTNINDNEFLLIHGRKIAN